VVRQINAATNSSIPNPVTVASKSLPEWLGQFFDDLARGSGHKV